MQSGADVLHCYACIKQSFTVINSLGATHSGNHRWYQLGFPCLNREKCNELWLSALVRLLPQWSEHVRGVGNLRVGLVSWTAQFLGSKLNLMSCCETVSFCVETYELKPWHLDQWPGPWFNIKMSSYQYRKSHCGDKTIIRSSYLHNGIFYTGKMSSSYWISLQGDYRLRHAIGTSVLFR